MTLEPFRGREPQVHPSAFVHPRATLIGDVRIGPEASVWPGAVLRADWNPITIGRATSIQDNTVVHVTARGGTAIGAMCIVGHLAFLEECEVGDACLVGVGSRILNGSRMEAGSAAAAQTVLLGGMTVPSGHRAQGIPARIVVPPTPPREQTEEGARVYVENCRLMLAEGAADSRQRGR
jgi:carbonic anhydrase/acetyltransferase-like protein (isoleucine patch superfamily)